MLLVTHVYRGKDNDKEIIRIISARRAGSRERRFYFKAPLSKQQKTVLKDFAAKQAAEDDSGIDYSDIPPLTDEQMATAIRGWRHFRRPILLERNVLDKLTEIAERKGIDLDVLVNDILRKEIAIAEVLR